MNHRVKGKGAAMVAQEMFKCCLCGELGTPRDSETALCPACMPHAEAFCENQPVHAKHDECDGACEDEKCPGWIVTETHGSMYGDGYEIERCGECDFFESDVAALKSVDKELKAFVAAGRAFVMNAGPSEIQQYIGDLGRVQSRLSFVDTVLRNLMLFHVRAAHGANPVTAEQHAVMASDCAKALGVADPMPGK